MDTCIITSLILFLILLYFILKFCLFSEKISGQESDSQGKKIK